MGRAESWLCSHETRTHDVLSQWTLGVSHVEEHFHTFIRIPWQSDGCFVQISKYWVSYKTWVEWCVSSLLSLMCEVNAFIFVRTVQCPASRRWRGSNVSAFDVHFCLSSVWFIYDPVSCKTSLQEPNPWTGKAWSVIPLLRTANWWVLHGCGLLKTTRVIVTW